MEVGEERKKKCKNKTNTKNCMVSNFRYRVLNRNKYNYINFRYLLQFGLFFSTMISIFTAVLKNWGNNRIQKIKMTIYFLSTRCLRSDWTNLIYAETIILVFLGPPETVIIAV